MEKEKNAPNANEGPTLEAVLSSFEAYVTEMTQSIIQASPEGETKILAESTSVSLSNQLGKVHGYIRECHNRLSLPQKLDFQEFLRVQDGVALAQQGIETCRKMFKKGGFGKRLLKWLVKFFQEIKKILKAILKLIFSIFGWTLPSWIDTLFLILDELVNLLNSIFGESLGIDVRSFERELSGMEVDYLTELAALERLQQAQRHRSPNEDEG